MGRVFSGLTVAAALLCAFPASAAVDAYLKLDGINGASAGGPATIELSNIAYGSGRAFGTAPPGIGPDRGDLHTLRVVKRVDRASQTLWAAAVSAAHFPTATLYVRKIGGATCEGYRLRDVVISGFETNNGYGGALAQPTERFTLNFVDMQAATPN